MQDKFLLFFKIFENFLTVELRLGNKHGVSQAHAMFIR